MTIKLLFPAENSALLVSLAWTAVECWLTYYLQILSETTNFETLCFILVDLQTLWIRCKILSHLANDSEIWIPNPLHDQNIPKYCLWPEIRDENNIQIYLHSKSHPLTILFLVHTVMLWLLSHMVRGYLGIDDAWYDHCNLRWAFSVNLQSHVYSHCRNLKDLCIEGTLAPELGKLTYIKSM